MPAHYYFTNSLPKLLMSALPLALFGLGWGVADRLDMLANGNSRGNGGKGFGKAVWEIWCLFGSAMAGLLGAMSAVGHKVGCKRLAEYALEVLTPPGMAIRRLRGPHLQPYRSADRRVAVRVSLSHRR
jgi:hypothetical protein